jgi:hypothetical protein
MNCQFTQEEAYNNRIISCARIYASIQRLKTFHIIGCIPYQFTKNANKILKVCVCLTNLQTPTIREFASKENP